MSPRLLRNARIVLVLIALSLAALTVRKSLQVAKYFSAPTEIAGTVVTDAFAKAIPMARGNPEAGRITGKVPTRLNVELREFPGVQFEIWLPEDPALHPPLPPAGSTVSLVLPGRWREMEVGPQERVLAFGLKQGGAMLVDPAHYPFSAEYRTLFLMVGTALGTLFAAVAALRLRTGQTH